MKQKKFAYNISQWITLYCFLLEHFNYEEAKKAGGIFTREFNDILIFSRYCVKKGKGTDCLSFHEHLFELFLKELNKKNIVKVVSK